MNTYDKLAMSNKPELYLSAPDTIDKSGASLFTLDNNNLSGIGQPIVYGNEFSFIMSSSTTVDVVGNPIFFNDSTTFECVIFASRPEQEVPIIIDDDSQNALLITPDGITLKLFFNNTNSTYATTATVDIKDWASKFYIIVNITKTQTTLTVNESSTILNYSDQIVDSSNITIGGGYSDYEWLMDGIGFYKNKVTNKSSVINDPYSGHGLYVESRYNGRSTKFDGYTSGYKESFGLDDFIYSDGQYGLIYYVTAIQGELQYISVKCNDERVTVLYDIDLDVTGEFKDYLLLTTVTDSTLRFIVNSEEVDSDFMLTIEGVSNGNVLYETPADLELSGLALYSESQESIVNCPDGVKLDDAAYKGTWIISEVMPNSPKSIELVFKPKVTTLETFIIASADGSVSYDDIATSITGYTATLNGNVVTDLSNMRMNQWNHLILTHATPTATEFYLNSDDGLPAGTAVDYMLLAAYPDELTTDQTQVLYQVVSGIDILEAQETATVIEGVFESGESFNSYSYTWAIVGGGGT